MRLIDADELLKYIPTEEMCSRFAMENALTVDAVPVVRCCDCMYYRPYSDGKMDCDNLLGMADVDPDDYCSRAERREE